MPTYSYACTECQHRFDAVQSFTDDSLTVCPECDGRLRKVFSAVGVVFKGGGFYRTDSRNGSSASVSGGSAAKGDGGSASSSSEGGSSSASSSPGSKTGTASSPASKTGTASASTGSSSSSAGSAA